MRKVMNWLRLRAGRIGVAWAAGLVVYMVGNVVTGNYDGFPSLICQPPIGVCVSGLFVFVAIIVGLPLALPSAKRLWSKAVVLNLAFLVSGFILLFFSQTLGLTTRLIDPETSQTFVGPHPVAVIVGFFLFVFSIVNWPFKPLSSMQGGEGPVQECTHNESKRRQGS
jgi:hypothetical protein